MREELKKNLDFIFAGEDALVVTDSNQLADWLNEQQIQTSTFDELEADSRVPTRAVAVPLEYDRLPSRMKLRQIFSDTSVLWIPMASFSSELDVAKYTLELFAASDIAGTVAKSRRVITQLLLARDKVLIKGPDAELEVYLPENLQILGRTRVEMLADEHVALGNYFEVALSPVDLAGQMDKEMSVSGTFKIDSALVATHREFKGTAAPSAAQEIADDMRKSCPFTVTVSDNRIVDGLGRWEKELETMCGPGDYAALTEVAVGTGVMPVDQVDWSLNTVVNEGATGTHIGIGNGLNGMHFDFISTEANLHGA